MTPNDALRSTPLLNLLPHAMYGFNEFHCVGVLVRQVYRVMYLYTTSTYEYPLVVFL